MRGTFASAATASTISQGYTCSAAAFNTIGALYGVGEAEVSTFADAEYKPVSFTLEYRIHDRVTGFGLFQARWSLTSNGIFDSAAGPGYVRIPLNGSHSGDFTVTVSLDGALAATHRFHVVRDHVLDLDATGLAARQQVQAAVISERDHPWLPDLRGHHNVSYDVHVNGVRSFGNMFLLPNWSAMQGQIAGALRAAEKLRRAHRCDRTIVLHRSEPSTSIDN